MDWIKCSERMPEPREDVLLHVVQDGDDFVTLGHFEPYDYGQVQAGRWQDSASCNSVGGRALLDRGEVTHWMPLPEPPR